MRQFFMLAAYLILSVVRAAAQGENNIWTFAASPGGNNIFINFSSGIPVLTSTPNYTTWYSIAVCAPNGQLRFSVRITGNTNPAYLNNIFDANGTPIPNSNLGSGIPTDGCAPIVIPRPGNPDQYYIFYSFSNGIRYSLLDMSLNNGTGGIVAGQKDVTIAAYGTVVAQKMVAVKGCNGVWLVVRSRVANQYYSYHVTNSGIDANAVISEAGNFSMYDYNSLLFGFLKAAPNGERLAICGWAGVELYDFEKCSGKVKNARVLEATGNSQFGPANLFNHYRYNGVCFSPDGTKLYVTKNHSKTSGLDTGKLYQYDLDQNSLSAIIASRTLIMLNLPAIVDNGGVCNLVVPNPLGEIKMGPDQKLYVDNGSYTCLNPGYTPPGYNPGPGFHVLNQPNIAGFGCQPQYNAIIVNNFMGNFDGSFYIDGGKSYLQRDIVVAPPPDTLSGQTYHPFACFVDSLILNADLQGSCYFWDDSTTKASRTIDHSGKYFVSYFKDCNYTTDTFYAEMIPIPKVSSLSPSCPGMFMGKLAVIVDSGSNLPLSFIWRDADSVIIRQVIANSGDTIRGIDSGRYTVEVRSASGCDTIIPAFVATLPKPQVTALPSDTTIRYGDSIALHGNGALLYTWLPSGIMDTATKASPVAKPSQPTSIMLIGMNEFGCEDTAFVKIDIDYSMPDFVPNAFSPNSDGLNDVFRIANITYQKVIAFRIYNRFGQQIFSTLDGQKGWDGNQDGKPCDIGTYYYLIQLDYPDGKRKTYKGDILLLR